MLKPLENRLVLRVKEEEEKSMGGIVLTSASQEKPQTAEVVAVGEGKTNHHGTLISPLVKIGDTVIFEKFAGTTVKMDDQQFLSLKDSDLLAIVE